MGSASSKFRRYLLNGDEYAALRIFQNTPELRRNLNPNNSYGDSLNHNSPLHLAAKYAIKPLLRIFLNELGGNPNQRNRDGETALHLACQGCQAVRSTEERRVACVKLILQCQGSFGPFNRCDSVDAIGNTALHYAAATGLQKCVEIIVSHGALLCIRNDSNASACDMAVENGHYSIAEYLEARMVFTDDCSQPDIVQEGERLFVSSEECSGLRSQDLQEAKDQLLVETSDMLHVPLFTAEVLLRNHEWSRQSLLDAWMVNPVTCCEDAGIQPPTSALHFVMPESNFSLKFSCEQIQDEYQNTSLNSPAKSVPLSPETVCEICLSCIPFDENPVQVPCLHQFCRSCWEHYLTIKIQDGEAHKILCPNFDCHHLVPIDVIENIVSPDMVKRYLRFDIEAFVDRNPSIKWCPYPGCGRAVKLPESDGVPQELVSLNFASPLVVSHSVDCGSGHNFCWECLGEPHAPCGCDKWKEWHEKIAEVKPEELENTYKDSESAANCLWMVTNSKPCPNCKSPIQKIEGCNHMKCSKCKYDFCWVCLEGWKKHSSSTGGYFMCKRYKAVQRAEVKAGILLSQAEKHNKQMQEIKRFLIYYTKYKAHEDSYKCEEPYSKNIGKKIESLSAVLQKHDIPETDLSFLEEATSELLRARRTLFSSYVYGYYLEDNGYNKTIFEFMQNYLEEVTEMLSVMVACRYLHTPNKRIKKATSVVKQKRLDFITAVLKGLIPPETPPSMRKTRRRRYPGLLGMDPVEDEEITQAIVASLEDMDPNDPWVKDHVGKHTNLSAMYDWPDCYSDEEDSSSYILTANLLGVCSRNGCSKPRARNPRTGTIHEYCSLLCLHADKEQSPEEPVALEADPSMDLLIALEMSKLQLAEDTAPPKEILDEIESSDLEVNSNITENVDNEELNCGLLENNRQIEFIDSVSETLADDYTKSPDEQSEEKLTEERPQDNTNDDHGDTKVWNEDNALGNSSPKPSSGVPLGFYLKNSCEHDLNFKNVNCATEDFSKTEKELFVEMDKAEEISDNEC